MAKKKRSATKTLLWILAAAVVLLVILGVVLKSTGLIGGGDKGLQVEVTEVEFRTITQIVTASGKIQPEVEVTISPDVSGEIVELRVKEGDLVQRGDLLARIEQEFYVAQVERAEAGVLQAKANQEQRRADMLNAELERGRKQQLFDGGMVSDSEYQLAVTQFDIAKAAFDGASYAVRSAEAGLKEAREQVSKTVIYSPMTGTVSKLDVELGERVVGTTQMAGTEMMRIAQLNQMEMEVDVNENDVVNVVLGDSASIEVDSYPERTFRGVVTEIANSARVQGAGTQEQITNFPVKIRVVDPHNVERQLGRTRATVLSTEASAVELVPSFRPGMSGTVDIFTHTIDDAIAVPIQAVTIRDVNLIKRDEIARARRRGEEAADSAAVSTEDLEEENLKRVVFLAEDGKAEMVEVETGISDDTHIQIRTGLQGGETVVIGPFRAVSRTLKPETAILYDEGGQEDGGDAEGERPESEEAAEVDIG
jgi:HlyD family secretion protein